MYIKYICGGACGALSHRSQSAVATGNRRPAVRHRRVLYKHCWRRARWFLRFKNIIFPPIFVHKILRVSYVAVTAHDILFPRQRCRRRCHRYCRRIPLSHHHSQTPDTPNKRCCLCAACPRLGRVYT